MTFDPTQDCLCSLDDNENIVAYSASCPLHKHLAPASEVLARRWCSGSSESVTILDKRTGRCSACRNEVPQKYGFAGVHLPDGSTPRG